MDSRVYWGAQTIDIPLESSVVTLGTFDGVHRGHQELVARAKAKANELGVPSVVYTFDPHPAVILAPARAPKLLLTIEQRVALLHQLGVDVVVVEPFNADFAALEAGDWVRTYLVDKLHPQHVVVGFNFSYGRGRGGNPEILLEEGKALGFGVDTVSPFEFEGEVVSSTRVRKLITSGELDMAARLLSRPFSISGVIERGDQRGREIGFPTANFSAPQRVVPPYGVYAVEVELEGSKPLRGVMNYGSRPTVSEDAARCEVHLFDFSGDLYGQSIKVNVRAKIRDEQKFETLDELVEQIRKDCEVAKGLLK
ncbi:MAG: bifunctional riboflavin kinase/FAD synthetase [Myxococcota bacterium]|nr:bifunctional riboflavin kinase/FAD synthetase [Myxococcota bacterium]